MNCKGCKFFKPVSCHGHGDFWGGCRLYDHFTDELEQAIKQKDSNVSFVLFNDVPYCYPETQCIFERYIGHIYKKDNKNG